MRAELKSLSSSDIDPSTYWPEDNEHFGFALDAVIGVEGEDAGDVFSFLVGTASWLALYRSKFKGCTFGQGTIIVNEYDFATIKALISDLCERTHGVSWEEIAPKLSKFGSWEYEGF